MTDSTLTFGRREWQLVYRVALRVLGVPDQAEDAAQDALMQAFAARDRFAGRAQPESWLYRIAYNTALSHRRRPFARRYSSADVFHALERDAALRRPSSSPEDEAVANQLAGRLRRCLAALRPKDRLAFTERFLLGASERELGELLGVSTNAAKQRAFRVRRAVRGSIAEAG